jgi:hypothetical protein
MYSVYSLQYTSFIYFYSGVSREFSVYDLFGCVLGGWWIGGNGSERGIRLIGWRDLALIFLAIGALSF